MSQTLYDDLGVSSTATFDEIKKAYRKLARKHHPDVNPGDKDAETRFKKISGAFDVLGDEEKRKLYDEFGEDSTRMGFDAERARAHKQWQSQANWRPGGQRAHSMDQEAEIFESLFGRRARPSGPRKGQDLHADLHTDFRTAALGGVRSLSFGDGSNMDVRIPPGVSDGGSIRLRGRGAPGYQGGPPGDLVITLHLEPHPVFRREGLDLHLDLPITIVEAIAGGKVSVPTLQSEVNLTLPPHTNSGQVMRLKGKGIERKDKDAGHLYVHIIIKAPDQAVDAKILETLAEAYQTDVRASLKEATR